MDDTNYSRKSSKEVLDALYDYVYAIISLIKISFKLRREIVEEYVKDLA